MVDQSHLLELFMNCMNSKVYYLGEYLHYGTQHSNVVYFRVVVSVFGPFPRSLSTRLLHGTMNKVI